MKKKVTIGVLLLGLSFIIPNIHRLYNNRPIKIFYPFLYAKNSDGTPLGISTQWYIKDLGESISYSLIIGLVVLLLQFIGDYFDTIKEGWHDRFVIFIRTWQRIFTTILVFSFFDIIHYCVSFRQSEWFYLLLSGVFWLMTCYYLFKLKLK